MRSFGLFSDVSLKQRKGKITSFAQLKPPLSLKYMEEKTIMNLKYLRDNEELLRGMYGDEEYGRMLRQSANKSAKPSIWGRKEIKPPSISSNKWWESNNTPTPGSVKPEATKSGSFRNGSGKRYEPAKSTDLWKNSENKFYTNNTNSGIISNKPKSIADYDKEIKDIENRITQLNKQQYNFMLVGEDNKVESLDMVIKNTQKQLEDMKAGKSIALGIGSETSSNMLRG